MAQLLTDGERPADELAGLTSTDSALLNRIMAFLASHSIFTETTPGVFAHTPKSMLLLPESDHSLHSLFSVRGAVDAAPYLMNAVVSGRPAFDEAFGTDYWTFLGRHTEERRLFDNLMVHQGLNLTLPAYPAVDWPPGSTVTDLGGGTGPLLRAIVSANPGVHGRLVERPEVIQRLLKDHTTGHTTTPVDLIAQDIFNLPPDSSDFFILARVLHDWNDEKAIEILTSLRRAAQPEAVLRIFEELTPGDGSRHPAPFRDIAMMLLFGTAHERSAADFENLLNAAGWSVKRIIPTASSITIIEAR